jgi:hypothetical protein
LRDLFQKYPLQKGQAEWFKVKALSSNPSTEKKKKSKFTSSLSPFFCQAPHSKYLIVCGLYGLVQNYLTLLLKWARNFEKYIGKWGTLGMVRLFMNTET